MDSYHTIRPRLSAWERGQYDVLHEFTQIRRIKIENILIRENPTNWIWRNYLARGTIAVLDGDPGVGKSLICLDLLSRVINEKTMPDGSPPATDGVDPNAIYVNNEDHHDTVIAPRIAATNYLNPTLYLFGGITNSVENVRPCQFPRDWFQFEKRVMQLRPPLVAIDTIASVFSPDICIHHDQSIREALTPMSELAAKRDTCILIVRHLTKRLSRAGLFHGSGSVGIIGAARTALYAGKHPTEANTFVLACTKSNFGPTPPSMKYRIVMTQEYFQHPLFEGPPERLQPAPVIEWLGPTTLTVDDLVSNELQADLMQTCEWLDEQLKDGPIPSGEILARAKTNHIPERNLRRAKRLNAVQSKRSSKEGEEGWVWEKQSN